MERRRFHRGPCVIIIIITTITINIIIFVITIFIIINIFKSDPSNNIIIKITNLAIRKYQSYKYRRRNIINNDNLVSDKNNDKLDKTADKPENIVDNLSDNGRRTVNILSMNCDCDINKY